MFNTSNDVVSAFKIHRVDAIVVDLATAFQLTATELPHTTIAGQFSAPGGDKWGVLLSKGSGLTSCVDRAVNALRANGTLARPLMAPLTGLNCASSPRGCAPLIGDGPSLTQSAMPLVEINSSRRSSDSAR